MAQGKGENGEEMLEFLQTQRPGKDESEAAADATPKIRPGTPPHHQPVQTAAHHTHRHPLHGGPEREARGRQDFFRLWKSGRELQGFRELHCPSLGLHCNVSPVLRHDRSAQTRLE